MLSKFNPSEHQVKTISTIKAAERLMTNTLVIDRWIREGKIKAAKTNKGYQVDLAAFEQLEAELKRWLQDCPTDDEGVVRVSVLEMNDFWNQREQGGV